jgi:hypothetical protein
VEVKVEWWNVGMVEWEKNGEYPMSNAQYPMSKWRSGGEVLTGLTGFFRIYRIENHSGDSGDS